MPSPSAPATEIDLAGAVVRVRAGVDAGLLAAVLPATRPVDFRKGAHGLAALASEVLREDLFSGAVLVFRCKRADRVKILVWDASGSVLVWEQMQQGGFRWPPVADGVVTLSAVQFAGLDWTRIPAARGGGGGADRRGAGSGA